MLKLAENEFNKRKFQALWNNIYVEAEASSVSDIVFLQDKDKGNIYFIKNELLEFQPENNFISENFEGFLSYLLEMLKIYRTTSISEGLYVNSEEDLKNWSKNGFCNYENLSIRYFFEKINATTKLSLRLYSINTQKTDLTTLGFTDPQIDLINQVIKKNDSGILVSGITASGKSSTLQHLISEKLKLSPLIKVLKVEGNTSEMKNLLSRSDTDLVGLGEIRDEETAMQYNKLRDSGVSVFATMHGHNSLSVLNRLDEMSNKKAHNHVDLIINQTLIKKLCPHCSIPIKQMRDLVDNAQSDYQGNYYNSKELVHLRLERSPNYKNINSNKIRVRNFKCCDLCGKTGYIGLTVCAEVLPIDPRMKDLLDEGNVNDVVMYCSYLSDNDKLSDNMIGKNIKSHAIYKMLIGEIDPSDIEEHFGSL